MFKTDEKKIGGSIALIGFGALKPMELIVVKKITGNYVKKISEVANYKELKLRLRQHQHGKEFLHEIEAEVVITKDKQGGKDDILSAKSTRYNLYAALSEVLEKIYNESFHYKRTSKEIGEERIKQEKKQEEKENINNKDALDLE